MVYDKKREDRRRIGPELRRQQLGPGRVVVDDGLHPEHRDLKLDTPNADFYADVLPAYTAKNNTVGERVCTRPLPIASGPRGLLALAYEDKSWENQKVRSHKQVNEEAKEARQAERLTKEFLRIVRATVENAEDEQPQLGRKRSQVFLFGASQDVMDRKTLSQTILHGLRA